MSAVLKPQTAALKLTRRYPHPPEKIFRAWTDPQALKRWFLPTPENQIVLAEADARVGGRYRIVVRNPDGVEHDVSGVYREVVAPARLVFTWAWRDTPERESLVTIELNRQGAETELVLTHEHLFDNEVRARHVQGWNGCLDHLGSIGLR